MSGLSEYIQKILKKIFFRGYLKKIQIFRMTEPRAKKLRTDPEEGELTSENSDFEDGEIPDSDEDISEKPNPSRSSTPKKASPEKIDSQYVKGVVLIRQGDKKDPPPTPVVLPTTVPPTPIVLVNFKNQNALKIFKVL